MNRIIALTVLCTASLAAGVVVASPSLASAFRSHPPRVHHPRWLWQYSVSGPAPGSANPEAETYPSTTRPAKHHHHAAAQAAPTPAATTPAATGDPAPPTEPTPTEPTPTKPAKPHRPPELPRFTLRSVDAPCFTAPSAPGGWPFAPTTAVHPIRGSFDEPRDPVHIGVDVEAPKDQAPVYAMQAGTVRNIAADHFDVHATHGARGTYLQYWHVKLAAGIKAGVVVRRRQLLGTVKPTMKHVHISEYVPGCGLVDPARPTGLLADPYNTEWPTIGSLGSLSFPHARMRRGRVIASASLRIARHSLAKRVTTSEQRLAVLFELAGAQVMVGKDRGQVLQVLGPADRFSVFDHQISE